LSAMAFTFVTVMKIEMEVSVATKTTTQTVMLDHWAVQQVVDKLIREPYEGAMYTPVDWAGEQWYTWPLILGSPALPTGGSMAFSALMAGKGVFTIDARIMDCSSQVNLADFNYDDVDARDRKIRLLSALPFGITSDGEPKGILGQEGATVLVDIVREIQRNDKDELLTKEQLLQEIMGYNVFKDACGGSEPGYSLVQTVALCFQGERDSGGNVTRVGFKDFITLHSWVDKTMLSTDLSRPQPRAPININTASTWTLEGVFGPMRSQYQSASVPSIVSKEGAVITREDSEELVDYIIAYRTPRIYLSPDPRPGKTESLIEKQDKLIRWIEECLDIDDDTGYEPDPGANPDTAEDALRAQLGRLAPLLANGGKREQGQELYLPRPFASWAQFDAFLKLLVYKANWGGSITAGRLKARAVMANCNPNVNHSDQPIRTDCVQWNCGKDQLEAATTELCFGSVGRFEIEMIVGQTSTVQGGAFSAGGNSVDDIFPGAQRPYNCFASDNIDTEKVRTIRGSVYAPDRLCFFNDKREMIMMRSLLDVHGDHRVVLDREVGPMKSFGTKAERLDYLVHNVSSWEIQRLESIKKWTAIVKFADAVRLSTVADFLSSADTTGRGQNALYYPEPEGKKLKSPSYDDDTVDSTEIDGSIIMETQDPEALDLHLRDVFTRGEHVGSIAPGGKYGPMFANGVWLKEPDALKYQFYELFPEEQDPPAGSTEPPPLTFTVGMWICLVGEGASGPIIDTTQVKTGKIKQPILLEIENEELRATLKGVIEPETKGAKPVPVTLSVGPIDISSWQPGQWHQVGLAFREEADTGGTQAAIFATVVNNDNEIEFQTEKASVDGAERMKLYADASGYADFGPIDALVDDIVVSVDPNHAEDPELLMTPIRFKRSNYQSPAIPVSELQGTDIEYGTVAWTEQLTSRSFPVDDGEGFQEDGDHYTDVRVTVKKGGSRIEPRAGVCENSSDGYDPLAQVPVWLCHDDLVIEASGNPNATIAKIGKCGEGQRLGDGNNPDDEYWTGTWEDGPTDLNVVGGSGDEVSVEVEMLGPQDAPDDAGGAGDDIKRNIVTPYVDDVTVTFFPPLELLYWKMATEPTE